VPRRTQLAARGEALDQTAARRTLTLGSCHYTRRDLEEIRDAGQMINIRVLGLARSGWLPRRRALPSPGLSGLRRCTGPSGWRRRGFAARRPR
jgi:hypothetical protein